MEQKITKVFDSIIDEYGIGKLPKKYSRLYCREVFSDWKVAKAIDSSTGGINLTGLESLRRAETLRKWDRGCLSSRTSVQRAQRELEDYMTSQLPISCWYDDSVQRKVVSFAPEDVLRYMLRHYGLEEIAKTSSVEIAITGTITYLLLFILF